VAGARLTKAADLSDRQCTVIDISEGGARRVEDPQFVKPQFQLKFDRTSPARSPGKKGDVIGIKFV
jgi:hypothetical protein